MAVTLTQLVAFLTVVRRGSVTAAAEELVVTQPSVSAAVSALERELGVTLTERAGRTLRPTAAGAAYARYASRRARPARARARAPRARRPATSRTRCASARSRRRANTSSPQLIQAFRERRPELEISLDVGNRERGVPAAARPQGGRGDHRPHPGRRAARRARLRRQRVRADHRAGRPAGQAPLGGGRGAGRRGPGSLREPGSGTRTLCEEWLAGRGHRADAAHARLERGDQAGGPRRPGGGAAVAGGGGARAGARAARHDLAARRPAARGAGTWSARPSAPCARRSRHSWPSAARRRRATCSRARTPEQPTPSVENHRFLSRFGSESARFEHNQLGLAPVV